MTVITKSVIIDYKTLNGSEWLCTFSGISAQIKPSDEYLHPENQSQISMSTDTEEYRILKSEWPKQQFGALISEWVG